MVEPLLSIEDLQTQYGTETGIVSAVRGLDFHIQPGETLGLIGESGCGKTTTVLSIMRLLGPNGRIVGGRVEFDGRNLLELSESEMRQLRGGDIAVVFQDAGTTLNPVLTVGEQIAEGLRLHLSLGRRAAWTRAEELLAAVSIAQPSKRSRQYPHQFSGGMRQRAMIAMAIACRPRLLIADEPTVAVDPPVQIQILDLIAELKQQLAMTVLLVTHDLAVAGAVCDRVAVMYAGRIVESADVETIFTSTRHPYTQRLLAAQHSIHDSHTERIPDAVTDIAVLSEACSFYPYCPSATDLCGQAQPPVSRLAEGHTVRCWREVTGE